MVDALRLERSAARRGGSSPSMPTNFKGKILFSLAEVGDGGRWQSHITGEIWWGPRVEGIKWKGGRVWLKALVLKTRVPQGTVGSNPTLSANTVEVAH